MKVSKTTAVFTLVLGLLSIAATRHVAMRVEIEPLRAFGSDTQMAVAVQIAPEDRQAIGRRALVQIEIKRGDSVIDRISRTVDVDANGQARVEVLWPPGAYDVRVDIEGTGRGNSGIWMGKTRVPRLEPEVTPTPKPAAAEAAAGATAAATGGQSPGPSVDSRAGDEAAAPPSAEVAAGAVAGSVGLDQPTDAEPAPVDQPVATPEAAPVVANWGQPDANLADLTVIVTDRSRPVPGLGAESFDLRVNGKKTAIADLGVAIDTPLFLGIAVDTSASMTEHLPEISRRLSRLVLQSLGDEGGVFLVTADADPSVVADWGSTISNVAQALSRPGSAADGDIAGMVALALDQFADRRGRKFLILLTDGGQSATRDDWKTVSDVVDAAGVPILVVGLRGDPFRERTRRNLDRFATVTGGKSYFIQDAGMLRMTFDYLTELIRGSYVMRFPLPRDGKVHKIAISTGVKEQQVLHPRTLR